MLCMQRTWGMCSREPTVLLKFSRIKYFTVLPTSAQKQTFTDKFSWSSFQPCNLSVMSLKFRGRKFSRAYSKQQNPQNFSTLKFLDYMVVLAVNKFYYTTLCTMKIVIIKTPCICVNGSPARYIFFPLLHPHSSFHLENMLRHLVNHSRKFLVAVVPVWCAEYYHNKSDIDEVLNIQQNQKFGKFSHGGKFAVNHQWIGFNKKLLHTLYLASAYELIVSVISLEHRNKILNHEISSEIK